MNQEKLPPTAIEIQIYAALLLKFFNQALDERLRNYDVGISSLQYGILRMLLFETLTISVLSQRMGLDPSTLVRSVDVLEREGLVQRGVDAHDRRRNPIHITEKGIALITAVPPIAEEDAIYHALETFGSQACSQLRDLLRELIAILPEGKLVVGMMSNPNVNK